MNTRVVELVEAQALSPSVRCLRFRCVDGAPLVFVPGQWINMWLETGGERIKRAYSIAGLAAEPDIFELAVTRVQEGAASMVLHAARPGYRCEIDGPHGFFTRHGLLDLPALFVATGSGLSPLRAMLHEAVLAPHPVPVSLLFGCRTEQDILWRQELNTLSAQHAWLSVHVTLSRPAPNWSGLRGYVQDHLVELLDRSHKPQVFICGLSPMIKSVRAVLKREFGYDRKMIHSERFD